MIKRNPAYKYFIIVLIIFKPLFMCAQHQVSGLIVDAANDKPMAFVNIAVIGSTYGTVSNQNGKFTINLDNLVNSDSIAFHYIGYRTYLTEINKLTDGTVIKLVEEKVKIEEVTILANPVTAEELISQALERKGENYPVIPQRMEVFKRINSATYIDRFDLALNKSNIEEIDTGFIKTVTDSIPRYSRSYSDNLYALYSNPGDSARIDKKIEGIKKVILEEDDGGELEQIENILMSTINKKEGEKTFWKFKTGILSVKVDETDSEKPAVDSIDDSKKRDSLPLRNSRGLYNLIRIDYANWTWDFIRKPNKYKYNIQSIVPINGEFAYAIRFDAKMRGDYQGMIYISYESNAILRIEYSIKERRKVGGFMIMGISFSELDDSGLLIYSRDENGYYLKYSMSNNVSEYIINRDFSLIKKEKRPIIRKKLNEVKLDLYLTGRDESCSETLVVSRERIDSEAYSKTIDKGVKPEYITTYSDTIWKGYSIIEPTKQMKEYKALK